MFSWKWWMISAGEAVAPQRAQTPARCADSYCAPLKIRECGGVGDLSPPATSSSVWVRSRGSAGFWEYLYWCLGSRILLCGWRERHVDGQSRFYLLALQVERPCDPPKKGPLLDSVCRDFHSVCSTRQREPKDICYSVLIPARDPFLRVMKNLRPRPCLLTRQESRSRWPQPRK